MSEIAHRFKQADKAHFSWAEMLDEAGQEPLRALEAEIHRSHGSLQDDHVDHYPQTQHAVDTLRKQDDVFDFEHPERYGKNVEQEANAKIARYLELNAKRGLQTFTDDEFDEYEDLSAVVEKGEYSAEYTVALIAQYREQMQFVRTQDYYDGNNLILPSVLRIPASKLQEVYYQIPHREDSPNPLHGMMDDEKLATPQAQKTMLALVDRCVGPGNLIMSTKVDHRVRRVVETYESPIDAVLQTFPTEKKTGADYAEYQQAIHLKTFEILRALNIPRDMRSAYINAAVMRNSTADGFLSGQEMKEDLEAITHHVRRTGIDRVLELHAAMGMENIWMYSEDEVDTFSKLVDKDPQTIEYMKAGDVTMVLADIRGDHNGAFAHGMDDKFSDDAGRTLRFEMTSAESIYRRFIFLNRLGILPSTVVYGAHGQPGATGVGIGIHRTNFSIDDRIDEPDAPEYETNININSTQLARVAREYMQTSIGIDSHHTQTGRKTIVLATCSGDKVVAGMGGAMPSSVAESVTRTINNPGVSVIAGEEVLYTHLNTDGSVTFVDFPHHERTGQEISTTNELTVGRRAPWERVTPIKRKRLEKFRTRKPQDNQRRAI